MNPQSLPDVDIALRERIAHLRHMAAVRDFVAEYEAEHGAFTPEEIAWAEKLLDESDARLAAKMADDAPAR